MTDKGLLRKISENATNAANALGEKIKENFLNPAEPPTPEPATPEPPREELVWAQDDLQLFHTYLRKGKQVVYYQNARRVHLDIVYVDPRKPGFIGRVIEGAFDYGFDGSASGAFFGGFSGSLVGLAVGSAVGAVAAATGTTRRNRNRVIRSALKRTICRSPSFFALKRAKGRRTLITWRRLSPRLKKTA